MAATSDNYEFALIGDRSLPFDGYVSTDDPTNTAPNVLVRGSQNVYKDLSQQIVNRCGLKRRGAGDPTEDGVITTYEWYDSLGRTIPLRVLASGKLQFESDLVTPGTFLWYDLQTTADNTRYIFAPWWDDTESKDLLLMVNGTSNIYAWSGGLITIGSVGTAVDGVSPTGLVVNTGGTGNVVGAQFEITGGGGVGAVIEVTAVDGGGAATAISLITPGEGYAIGTGYTTILVSGTSGGAPTVDVATIATYGTITKSGTTTWLQSGFIQGDSMWVNGVSMPVSYGINSTTVYTTGDPSAAPIGSLVFATVVVTANTPDTNFHNDFCIVFNNQFIVGSYTSRLVYASANTDYTTFGDVSPFFEGLQFILILDDTLRGFAIRQGNLQISAGQSDWYEVVLSTTNISGTTYANIAIAKKPGATLSSALGQEFIVNNGDDIYYVAQDHQIYVYGAFTNQFNQRFPALSQAVRDELTEEDFTGGALKSVNDSLYLISITSGKTYTYSARQFVNPEGNIVAERLWYPPQVWNISRVAVIDGVVFGASSENPQYYQLFNTGQFHDDTPTTQVAPYECVARFAYWNFGKRYLLGDLNRLYIEGYIAENSPLDATLRLNYLGSTDEITKVISALNDNPVLYSANGVALIGSGVGDHLIGGGGLDEFGNPALPKFREILNFQRSNVFEYQIELYSYTADSQWKILALGTNGSKVTNMPVFLQKP